MKKFNSLSVIIPVFNGQDYIREAVESVLSQTLLPEYFEILLIDDGSADNSLAICYELESCFLNVRCLALGKNCGVAHARNVGIVAAQYQYLAFIDQDDVWATNKLELQVNAIKLFHQADYFLCHQSFFLHNLESYPTWFNRRWAECPQPGYIFAAILIEKAVFLEVGLLNESYGFGGDDVDWFARAKNHGKQMHMLPDTLVNRKIHAHNSSQRTAQSNRELLRVIRNNMRARDEA